LAIPRHRYRRHDVECSLGHCQAGLRRQRVDRGAGWSAGGIELFVHYQKDGVACSFS
jgi:hypothetical protein